MLLLTKYLPVLASQQWHESHFMALERSKSSTQHRQGWQEQFSTSTTSNKHSMVCAPTPNDMASPWQLGNHHPKETPSHCEHLNNKHPRTVTSSGCSKTPHEGEMLDFPTSVQHIEHRTSVREMHAIPADWKQLSMHENHQTARHYTHGQTLVLCQRVGLPCIHCWLCHDRVTNKGDQLKQLL